MPEEKDKKQLDMATIESEFMDFLEEKGYDLSAKIEMEQDFDTQENSYAPTKQKPIRKISEDLNDREWDFDVFLDTRKIMPGMVVYTIESIAPTEKTRYVTYKPAPRIITEIQDNGVNNGTLFLTYSHEVMSIPTYRAIQNKEPQVVSKTEVIYSPLTKSHAEYICKLLNLQSKQMYKQYVKAANQNHK